MLHVVSLPLWGMGEAHICAVDEVSVVKLL